MLAHVYNRNCEEKYFNQSEYTLITKIYKLKLNKIFFEKVELKDIIVFFEKHYK